MPGYSLEIGGIQGYANRKVSLGALYAWIFLGLKNCNDFVTEKEARKT